MRSTGTYAISTTLGESVQAFVPHALPPAKPALAPECCVEANRVPMMPSFNIDQVRQKLGTTFPTANAAVMVLEDLGLVAELTGQKKNRSYSYTAYIALLAG